MENEKLLRARRTGLYSYQLTVYGFQLRKKEVKRLRIKEFLMEAIGCLMLAVRRLCMCSGDLELRTGKIERCSKWKQ